MNNHKTLEMSWIAKLYRVMYITFFCLLAFGQFERIQILNSVAFYLHEIILSAWCILFLYIFRHDTKKLFTTHLNKSRLLIYLVMYVVFQQIILSLVDLQLHPFLYLVRLAVYSSLFWLIWLGLKKMFISKTYLLQTLFCVGLFIALMGLLQYKLLPDVRFLYHLGWDDHYYRLISTLFDPGYTALILVIGFFLLQKITFKNTLFKVLLSVIFIVALLLTYSRAGYLAFSFASVYALWKERSVLLFILLVFFLGFIPFLPRVGGEGVKLERVASIVARSENISTAITTLSPTEVVLGRGFYRNIQTDTKLPNHSTAPSNSYVFIFVSLGIIGTVLLAVSLWEISKIYTISGEFVSIYLAIAVHSLFNNSLFYIWTLSFLLPLLALSASSSLRERGSTTV